MKSTQIKQSETGLSLTPCMVCGKRLVYGYYGRWGDSGTCSRKCESEQETRHETAGNAQTSLK
jgi:hypothetical protein